MPPFTDAETRVMFGVKRNSSKNCRHPHAPSVLVEITARVGSVDRADDEGVGVTGGVAVTERVGVREAVGDGGMDEETVALDVMDTGAPADSDADGVAE